MKLSCHYIYVICNIDVLFDTGCHICGASDHKRRSCPKYESNEQTEKSRRPLKRYFQLTVCQKLRIRLRSHRREYESESGFPFTGCLSLVQASPARVERSLVQAHNSTRVYWHLTISSEIESSECFAKK